MNVIKSDHKEIQVYDNYDFKPCLIDDITSFSVRCCFNVSGMWYVGQFDFKDRVWSVLPSDVKKEFLDFQVCLWFYLPDLPDLPDCKPSEEFKSKNRYKPYTEGKEPLHFGL